MSDDVVETEPAKRPRLPSLWCRSIRARRRRAAPRRAPTCERMKCTLYHRPAWNHLSGRPSYGEQPRRAFWTCTGRSTDRAARARLTTLLVDVDVTNGSDMRSTRRVRVSREPSWRTC